MKTILFILLSIFFIFLSFNTKHFDDKSSQLEISRSIDGLNIFYKPTATNENTFILTNDISSNSNQPDNISKTIVIRNKNSFFEGNVCVIISGESIKVFRNEEDVTNEYDISNTYPDFQQDFVIYAQNSNAKNLKNSLYHSNSCMEIPFKETYACDRNKEENEYTIFPNPSNSLFNLKNSSGDSFDYVLTNANGEFIRTKEGKVGNEIINLVDFPSGVYFVYINSPNKTTCLKLIKID